MKTLPLAFLLTTLVAHAQTSNSSSNHVWKLTSARVQRILVLEGGRFFTRSWIDRTTGRDLQSGMTADELGLTVNGKELTGLSGGWSLVSESTSQKKDGSSELDLTLRHGDMEATKSYVTYPASSILREWVTFKNVGSASMIVVDPHFLHTTSRIADLKSLDFYWMTGGENRADSWLLKTEAFQTNQSRNFDSYDAFPGAK